MRGWIRYAVGCVALACGVASVAYAQDDVSRLVGRPVATIHFEEEGRSVTSAALDSLVPLKAGDALRLDAIRDAESHLINARRYENVRVTVTDGPAGLDLLFSLTPRHPVDRLDVTGDTGLARGELESLIRERYGGLPAQERPDAVAQVVTGLLRDEGYPDARVRPRVEVTHDPDRATLVLDIAAGSRPLIARTEVKGTSPLPADRVIALTDTAAGRPFRRRAVETRLAGIGDDLRKQGYYSVVTILPNEPVMSDAEHGFIVWILVEAGPRVTLRWDGPKPEGDEEDFVPMRRQQSVDEDLLEDSDQRVASYFKRLGYNDVHATHTRELQDNQLVITMHVVPGLRYRVQDLKVTGNAHMATEAIVATLAVRPGAPYDDGLIANGIAKLKLSYFRLGYPRVTITEAKPEEIPGSRTATDVSIIVGVDVAEGPEVHLGEVTLAGNRPAFEVRLRGLMRSQPRGLYVVEQLLRDKADLEAYYRNLGFENVEVGIKPAFSEDQRTATVAVTITEGPQIEIGDIRVIGNRSVSEKSIKEQLVLKERQPFGEEAQQESRRKLLAMGVFRMVSIEEEPRASGETLAHVIVSVEELPPTSISYGAGFEGGRRALRNADGLFQDRIVVAPRGFFEIGRRNLWGKNRSVDFFSRIAPQLAKTTVGNFGFLEYRVSGTYREPNAFDSGADALLGITSEQAARTGFNFERKGVNLQFIRRASPHVSLSGRYGLDYTRIFDFDVSSFTPADRITIDKLFPQVRLSTLSASALWDRRDDLVDPSHGTLASADVELAARRLGSEVGFSRVFLQASGFHALNSKRRVVLAGRAEVGMARGFERQKVDPDTGQLVTVADLPVSQRFFAGGSTTVRGFQLDRLGVPAILTSDGLSLGGNGVVVLNAEVRATLRKLFGKELGVAFFTDAGNVFAKAVDIDLTQLRHSVGFGVRYNSPLGPVRLDFGFKTDRQVVGGRRESGWEYHLNIGEAF